MGLSWVVRKRRTQKKKKRRVGSLSERADDDDQQQHVAKRQHQCGSDGDEENKPPTPTTLIEVATPTAVAPTSVSEPTATPQEPTTAVVVSDEQEEKEEKEEEKEEDTEEEEEPDYQYLAQEELGSYSGVHSLRRKWVDAAIKWCEAYKERCLDGVVFMLSSWKQDAKGQRERIRQLFGLDDYMANAMAGGFDPEGGINYDKIPKFKWAVSSDQTSMLAMVTGLPEELVGLYHFVCHADNEGEYTPTECERIRRTYDLIREHFEDEETRLDFDQIMNVVDISVREQLPLVFC